MTVERTIADLVEEVGDLSLVADALRDASRKRDLDFERLRSLLAPLAQRNGLERGDGAALLKRLTEIAGIDSEAVARRVAADAALGPRIAASYFVGLSKEDLDRLVMAPEMQQTMRSIQESVAATVRSSMAPQLADINAAMERATADPVKYAGLDEVARRISAQLFDSDVMERVTQGWATALSDGIALEPETFAAIREAQKALRD